MLILFGFCVGVIGGVLSSEQQVVGPAQGGLPEYKMSELPAREIQAHYLSLLGGSEHN